MGEAPAVTRLLQRLDRITSASPTLGLRLAALAGVLFGPRLGNRWCPSSAELEAFLGGRDGRKVRRLRGRIAAGELRNRAARYLLAHRGAKRLAEFITVRGASVLRRLRDEKTPTVVLLWHQGAGSGLETALSGIGLPFFIATNAPKAADCGYRWKVVEDAGDGMQFMVQALKEVQNGGIPVLFLDTALEREDRLSFFAGSLPIPVGAAWLAARTGARLVPVTSRWVGFSARIEVTLHEPIPEPGRAGPTSAEWEREFVESGVQWYEDYLCRNPETLSLAQIRKVLEPPRSGTRVPSDDEFARLAEDFDAAD